MIAGLEDATGVGIQPPSVGEYSGSSNTSVLAAPATARSVGWVEGSAVSSTTLTAPAPAIDPEDWVAPDEIATPLLWRRALRTTLPFVAADVLALSVCGLIAQAILYFTFPAAARQIGFAGAFALCPLAAFYWLGGLYSDIWVHPVLELRQMTHL